MHFQPPCGILRGMNENQQKLLVKVVQLTVLIMLIVERVSNDDYISASILFVGAILVTKD